MAEETVSISHSMKTTVEILTGILLVTLFLPPFSLSEWIPD